MDEDRPTPATLRAAHQLYQYVFGRTLEQVEVTTSDIMTLLESLGVGRADTHVVFRAAIFVAKYYYDEAPEGADAEVAQAHKEQIMYTQWPLEEAHFDFLHAEGIRMDEELERLEARLKAEGL